MNMHLEQLNPEDWKVLTTSAHKVVYGTDVPNDFDRIDFALLIRNDDEPMGFATISEINKHTAYMQDGGAFPGAKDTVFSLRGYMMMMNWLKENYLAIRTHIHSKNHEMIRFAMAAGLSISGTEFHDGGVYVNFSWEDEVG